jgi:acyl-CoA thioesterase I
MQIDEKLPGGCQLSIGHYCKQRDNPARLRWQAPEMKMDDWLNLVIYFVGSGNAFFLGIALLVMGIGVSFLTLGRMLRLVRNLAVAVGVILIAISATPLPWWLYAILALFTLGWLSLEWRSPRVGRHVLLAARLVALAVWSAALAFELPYHFAPARLSPLGMPKLFVIGDSVSAGMKEGEQGTWPRLLAKKEGIEVDDFSKMGATVGSARTQAGRIGDENGIVLLEIGGNDLLSATTSEEFAEQLDLLLAETCRRGRIVLMLELPLPPFHNRFGMIQRDLAAKHGVLLIPKRVFIGILTTSGATLDGIHLTPAGHAQLADAIWRVISPAYGRN